MTIASALCAGAPSRPREDDPDLARALGAAGMLATTAGVDAPAARGSGCEGTERAGFATSACAINIAGIAAPIPMPAPRT